MEWKVLGGKVKIPLYSISLEILSIYMHNKGWRESGFNCCGVREPCALVILVLCECIWNTAAVLLVFPSFDNTGSLGCPLH